MTSNEAPVSPLGDAPPPTARAPRSQLAMTDEPIDRLTADAANPRLHSRKHVRQIAASIRSFGFNVPILIDAARTVVAGHGRLLAARELGLTTVPTIQLDHLSEAQRRAFMIADNRLTEISGWDDRLLAEQLKTLSTLDLDFDLEATGFDMGEIDLRIEALEGTGAARSPEPPLPAPTGPVVTRAGDLWTLGHHRVACGSALDEAVYQQLMGGHKAAAVFADPPYNVPIEGHVSGSGALHHREFAMAAGEMTPEAFTRFLATALELSARHCLSGSLLFICMDWRHMAELLAAAAQVGLQNVNLCVWTKPNGGMGSLYRSQHELVFVFRHGAGAFRNNVELGRHGRNRSNVWAYATHPGFGRAGEEGRLEALHPTIKPVALVADAILDCSKRRDIVLDSYLGSGTTLMAAERTGRRCFGIELDPLYVDTIIRRWQALTGGTARNAASGLSFDRVAAERTPTAAPVTAHDLHATEVAHV